MKKFIKKSLLNTIGLLVAFCLVCSLTNVNLAKADNDAVRPSAPIISEQELNAGNILENPYKKTFDYWGNANDVSYTENGVIVKGTNTANIANIINGPMTIAGDELSMVISLPIYDSATGNKENDIIEKVAVKLFSGSSELKTSFVIWGDSYNFEEGHVTAEIKVGGFVGDDSDGIATTLVHIPKSVVEINGGVKIGFSVEKGWCAEIVNDDGTINYQAVSTDADYLQRLSVITAKEVTRINFQQIWDEHNEGRIVFKELNGQNLCLENGSLSLNNWFNLSSIKVDNNVDFVVGRTYNFELLSTEADSASDFTDKNQRTTDAEFYAYAYVGAEEDTVNSGDIGYNLDGSKGSCTASGIYVTVIAPSGTTTKAYTDSWGKAYEEKISFTIEEEGEYTVIYSILTVKGFLSERSITFTATYKPYISVSENIATNAYTGQVLTLPSASLMGNTETVLLETVGVSAKINDNDVEIINNALTFTEAGDYVVMYSVNYNEELYTKIYRISVKLDVLQSINIKEQPSKKTYVDGDSFDKTGLVVEAVYESGKTEVVNDYTLDKNVLKEGDTSIIVDYQGKKANFSITVNQSKKNGCSSQIGPGLSCVCLLSLMGVFAVVKLSKKKDN